jgi:hypothetical protein
MRVLFARLRSSIYPWAKAGPLKGPRSMWTGITRYPEHRHWAHSVRFHPMLQHVTRSRGWNIMERVNGNVGDKIELGMEIPTIKSRILQVSQK